MGEPRIHILGVYRLSVTDELFREQFALLYGSPSSAKQRAQAERRCREQLSSVVLVEAMVRDRDARFDVADFVQPQEGVPESQWQVAWAEAYLTLDGESIMVERWSEPPESGDLRVAFYMHHWNPASPLSSSYGVLPCPQAQEMPERLQRLVPYEPLD